MDPDPPPLSPWDQVAAGYLHYWVPRFRPFVDAALERFSPAPGPLAVPGCGPGGEVLALLERYPEATIHAEDPASNMLEALRRSLPPSAQARVRIRQAKASELALRGAGGLFSSFALQLLPDPQAALSAWARALAPAPAQGALLFWPHQLPDSAWGRLRAAIQRHAPAPPDPTRLAAAELAASLPALGLRLISAETLTFPISYASPQEAWTRLVDSGPLQGLLRRAGPERTAASEAAWLASPGLRETRGGWTHEPQARLWLVEALR